MLIRHASGCLCLTCSKYSGYIGSFNPIFISKRRGKEVRRISFGSSIVDMHGRQSLQASGSFLKPFPRKKGAFA